MKRRIVALILVVTAILCLCFVGCEEKCEHVGGTADATCVKKAICKRCGQPYGDYSTTNHAWQNGVCLDCEIVCEPHTFSNGECTNCKLECQHSYVQGVCATCNMVCLHSYSNGVCLECEKECSPHTFSNGECTNCTMPCEHNYANGVCTICLQEHSLHSFYNGTCLVCGAADPKYTPGGNQGGTTELKPADTTIADVALK